MNESINNYKKEKYPESKDVEACVPELNVDDAEERTAPTVTDPQEEPEPTKVHVICEDYGQAIPLPSYRYEIIL